MSFGGGLSDDKSRRNPQLGLLFLVFVLQLQVSGAAQVPYHQDYESWMMSG